MTTRQSIAFSASPELGQRLRRGSLAASLGLVAGLGLGCPTPAEQGEDENGEAADSEGECQMGTLGCPCFEGACLGELTCEDDVCVSAEDESSSGETSEDSETSTSTEEGTSEDSSSEDSTSSEDESETSGDTGEGFDQDCPTGTFAGCEFYGARLSSSTSQFEFNRQSVFAFVNPSETDAVEVTVERKLIDEWVIVDEVVPVPPLGSVELETTENNGYIVFAGVDGDGYRIRSTGPIHAYQISKVDVAVAHLLPTSMWGQEYVSVDAGKGVADDDAAGYAVVVALADETTVTVEARRPIAPGPGIPVGTGQGDVLEVELQAGDTLGLFSDGADFATAAGHRIVSDKPVGVFGGKQFGGSHVEGHAAEQLLPLSLWSNEFVGPYLDAQILNFPPDRIWRTVASEDSTFVDISFDENDGFPPSPVFLTEAGSHVDWGVGVGFRVSAAKPFALAALFGGDTFDLGSLAVIPGTDQMLESYMLYAPTGSGWATHRVVTVTQTAGSFTIDGAPASPTDTEVLVDGWVQRIFELEPGAHVLEGDDPFFAVAYGWQSSGLDGYAYTAGLAL